MHDALERGRYIEAGLWRLRDDTGTVASILSVEHATTGLPSGSESWVDRATFVQSHEAWLDDSLTRDVVRADAIDEEDAEWALDIARCLLGIRHGRGCTKPQGVAWLRSEAPDSRSSWTRPVRLEAANRVPPRSERGSPTSAAK
jgi:hypothetical protein